MIGTAVLYGTRLWNGADVKLSGLDYREIEYATYQQARSRLSRHPSHGTLSDFGMSKIPQSAACNESVKLAIKFGNRGMSKFVNGILRNAIRRSKEFVIPSMEEDVEQHLSLTYHQQPWLIKSGLVNTVSMRH